jgi:SH3-like domain-containing protein
MAIRPIHHWRNAYMGRRGLRLSGGAFVHAFETFIPGLDVRGLLSYRLNVMGKKITLLLVFLAAFSFPFLNAGAVRAQGGETAPEADAATSAPGASLKTSGLPIPRFVSLSSEKVFIRTGPGLRYPIKWVYERPHMPVEIIGEFDTWRRIRDIDGDDGWIHQSMLSGGRSGIVKGEVNLSIRKEPSPSATVIAFVEPNAVVTLEECKGDWCEVDAQGFTGWVERKFLWGIYDSEEFN